MNMTDINVCSHPAVSSGSRTLSGARLAAPAAWAFPSGVGEAGQADGTTSSSSQTVTLRATYQPSPRFLFFFLESLCCYFYIKKSIYLESAHKQIHKFMLSHGSPEIGLGTLECGTAAACGMGRAEGRPGRSRRPRVGGRATHAASGLWLPPSQAF